MGFAEDGIQGFIHWSPVSSSSFMQLQQVVGGAGEGPSCSCCALLDWAAKGEILMCVSYVLCPIGTSPIYISTAPQGDPPVIG